MTLRLTEAETEALRATAEAQGVSMQEVARAAIRSYTSTWEAERAAFLADFALENRELLDRLGR